MTLADAEQCARSRTFAGYALDRRAVPYLRAHLLWRRQEGAAPTDPLLPLTERYMSDLLNRIAQELGIKIESKRPRDLSRNTLAYWQYRDGFLLQGIKRQ